MHSGAPPWKQGADDQAADHTRTRTCRGRAPATSPDHRTRQIAPLLCGRFLGTTEIRPTYLIGVGGGDLASRSGPVGCGAFVVSCPRRVGSDTSSGCLAQHRGPFSSRSTTRSKGEKRREKYIILKCGPWRGRQEIKREIQRCRDNHLPRNRRTVECVWSMSSLLGVCNLDKIR